MAAVLVTPTELAAALGWPDSADLTELEQVCDAANEVTDRWLDPDLGPHDDHPQDKEAALAIAVQIYNTRTAPGGQSQAVDFGQVITPHLLGPGLSARVMGLLGVCRKYGGLVIG